MKNLYNYCFLIGLLIFQTLIFSSQLKAQKETFAVRINQPVNIDGNFDESFWATIEPASNFSQYTPYNGLKPSQKTEFKIAYDNSAFYIAVTMLDTSPDSILTEYTKRDQGNHNADRITIMLNPFNDGINWYKFEVTPNNVQRDIRSSPIGDDETWNAVWESDTKINESGWNAEFKIPFSAIRFPTDKEQIWGLNVWREIRRYREWATWVFSDQKVSGNQYGFLKGISDINSPVRLSVSPYTSGYIVNYDKNSEYSFNYGMDLKYGITESFTLDMVLIPDFGQVQSDDQILNLGPFETKYDEKRDFFVEGTDLFNKTGVFYSRRIGDKPVGYNKVSSETRQNEIIVKNQANTNLMNISKITGRTNKGLGIGLINAVSSPAYAEIKDTISEISRDYKTQAFTNYNVFVLDQTLKNQSYINFINTNKSIFADDYYGNLTGAETKLSGEKRILQLFCRGVISQKYTPENTDFGKYYTINAAKINGNFRTGISQSVQDENYDPNDMGYLAVNNVINRSLYFQYYKFKPFGKFLSMNNSFNIYYNSMYAPRNIQNFYFVYSGNFLTKKQYLYTYWTADFQPVEGYDFYSSRVSGRFMRTPQYYKFTSGISTDYRKVFAFDGNISFKETVLYNSDVISYTLAPRIRVNDRMLIIHDFSFYTASNNRIYVTNLEESGDIIYGTSRNITVSNTLTTNYIFTAKTYLSFRLRHYRATVDYSNFNTLEENGYLTNSDYSAEHNINFNTWNLNLAYTWNFAPGSELSVVWKNDLYSNDSNVSENYIDNFSSTFDYPAYNSISLKILYWLDYVAVKDYFKGS